MAIAAATALGQIAEGLAVKNAGAGFDKASIANMAAGQIASLWRATGVPGQAAIPATATVCNSALLGALTLNNKISPEANYLAYMRLVPGNANTSIEVFDRLGHMGGLNGTVITAQVVGVDASLTSSNLVQRVGPATYAGVRWFLEWYTDTGATSVNHTLAVTYDDNSTGNIVLTAVGATIRASRLIPIIPAVAGRNIKSIQTDTLSATTAAAGNFGVTAARFRTTIHAPVANVDAVYDWAQLGLPDIYNDSCLMLVMPMANTTTGAVRGGGKIIYA